MAINKKPPVMCSHNFAQAMDTLTKACLVDLCIDLVRRMEGANETEWKLLYAIETEYLPAVIRARGSRATNLVDEYFRSAKALRRIAGGGRDTDFRTASMVADGLLESDGRTLTDDGKQLLTDFAECEQKQVQP